ncbi:hypothetical protein CSUI_010867 [Cystoisospora suis]|uniref:Uncharacterized protein n=1 Tax=Cystoisospora suis TaxID=483139 RepID=A0A2C6KFK2_9APIC|nr:hypothetical protein CSUI_010867 [Cystoisospora suis]
MEILRIKDELKEKERELDESKRILQDVHREKETLRENLQDILENRSLLQSLKDYILSSSSSTSLPSFSCMSGEDLFLSGQPLNVWEGEKRQDLQTTSPLSLEMRRDHRRDGDLLASLSRTHDKEKVPLLSLLSRCMKREEKERRAGCSREMKERKEEEEGKKWIKKWLKNTGGETGEKVLKERTCNGIEEEKTKKKKKSDLECMHSRERLRHAEEENEVDTKDKENRHSLLPNLKEKEREKTFFFPSLTGERRSDCFFPPTQGGVPSNSSRNTSLSSSSSFDLKKTLFFSTFSSSSFDPSSVPLPIIIHPYEGEEDEKKDKRNDETIDVHFEGSRDLRISSRQKIPSTFHPSPPNPRHGKKSLYYPHLSSSSSHSAGSKPREERSASRQSSSSSSSLQSDTKIRLSHSYPLSPMKTETASVDRKKDQNYYTESNKKKKKSMERRESSRRRRSSTEKEKKSLLEKRSDGEGRDTTEERRRRKKTEIKTENVVSPYQEEAKSLEEEKKLYISAFLDRKELCDSVSS